MLKHGAGIFDNPSDGIVFNQTTLKLYLHYVLTIAKSGPFLVILFSTTGSTDKQLITGLYMLSEYPHLPFCFFQKVHYRVHMLNKVI